MNTLFADKLGKITTIDGVVHLDFLAEKDCATSDTTQNNTKELEPSVRLAMPLELILETVEMLDNMKIDLKEMAKKQLNSY